MAISGEQWLEFAQKHFGPFTSIVGSKRRYAIRG
jgi:hypothetical protein